MPSIGSSSFKAIKGITIYGITGNTGPIGPKGEDLYGPTGPTATLRLDTIFRSGFTLYSVFKNSSVVSAGFLKGITGNTVSYLKGKTGSTGTGHIFVNSSGDREITIRKLKGTTGNRSSVNLSSDSNEVTINVTRYDGGFTLGYGQLSDIIATDGAGNFVGVTLEAAKYGSSNDTVRVQKVNVFEKTRSINSENSGSVNYVLDPQTNKITVFLHPENKSNNSVDRNSKAKIYAVDLKSIEDVKFIIDKPSGLNPIGFSLYVTSTNEAAEAQFTFSDNFAKLAVYDNLNNENTIKLFDVNFDSNPNPFTFSKSFSVASIPIQQKENRKMFISNDGSYMLISCPTDKKIYFIDTNNGTILQTITENYTNFGSKIGVDQDFYGMAISTYDLTRAVDSYDGRINSYGISSPICYYKRNYGGTTASFRKIHEHNAHTDSRHNGLASLKSNQLKINVNLANISPPSSSLIDTVGINRCDDIKCKGYNFSAAFIAKESDQILYKAHFPNVSNTKYDIVRSGSGFTYENIYSDTMFYKTIKSAGATFYYGPTLKNYDCFSDVFLQSTTLSNYFMEGTFGLKNFSIVRKINGEFITDGSYRTNAVLTTVSPPELSTPKQRWTDSIDRKYDNTFMGKMYSRNPRLVFDVPTEGSSIRFTSKFKDSPERQYYFREETNNTKVCINSNNDVYIVSKYITNSSSQAANNGVGITAASQNLQIPNLRIHRFPATNESGTDSYQYNDYIYESSNYIQTPNSLPYGLIKIAYRAEDENFLEKLFSNTAQDTGIDFTTGTYLADPSLCPSSNFAQTISNLILQQTIQNCFVSNNYLFISLDTDTLVYKINNTQTYKSLSLDTILNFNMNKHTHAYNATSDFFINETDLILYKYNTTTKILDQINFVL